MKYLLLLLLLVGCTDVTCPKYEYRQYIYNDAVTVTGGFYKGYKGLIKKRASLNQYGCNIPAFEVRLNLPDKYTTVTISQYYLFVEHKLIHENNTKDRL